VPLRGYQVLGSLKLLQGYLSQLVLAFLLFENKTRFYRQSNFRSHVFRLFITSKEMEINQCKRKATPQKSQVIVSASHCFSTSGPRLYLSTFG
jgi:hypothetical protein